MGDVLAIVIGSVSVLTNAKQNKTAKFGSHTTEPIPNPNSKN